MAVLVVFLLLVTWLPGMLLLLLQALFAGSFTFVRENLFLVPAITVFSLVQVLAAAFSMLALSSLSNSARFVAVLYAGLVLFTRAMFEALRGITGSSGLSWLSFTASLEQVGDLVFRQRLRYDTPAAVSFIVLLGLIAISALGARTPRARRGGGHMSASVVTSTQLSKWYGQVIGLNDVTVSVEPGITGLLGPNGAGKSTFMKLDDRPAQAEQGRDPRARRADLGQPGLFFDIGFCPEQDSFYDRMTGLEWVTALLRLNGLDDAAAAAAARRALEAVDLMDAADKKIGAYSKGMRQRVKLAQAIAHDPKLLILDEPLSGMDPIGRRKTIRMIRDWARAGKSVVVSSHILHEIEAMTSTILLINNGRILAEGDVHQIRELIDEHPHTVSVKAENPRAAAREFLALDHVLSLKLEAGAVVVETARPDAFYTD